MHRDTLQVLYIIGIVFVWQPKVWKGIGWGNGSGLATNSKSVRWVCEMNYYTYAK